MSKKKWFFICLASLFLGCITYLVFIITSLPKTYSLDDYNPPLISFVLDRNGETIGEFFKERRKLVSTEDFPKHLIQAFVAAEDGSFFSHKGIEYQAIFRAFIANIKARKKAQGGSTITQQVARSLLLSSKKTYTRKLKEIILALRMERHLTKEEILYLYLNQIYLGHGAYGVGMASHIYFQKEVKDLTLEESALLAGLPQAPSNFSPISNAKKAKDRQHYVLNRMAEERYISHEDAQESFQKPLKVFMRQSYFSKAPYFVETVRQLLIEELGEKELLTGGWTVHTSLDLKLQKEAQIELKKGLEDLDKRQGFRGPIQNISTEETQSFFTELEKKWIRGKKTYRILTKEGEDEVLDSEFEHINTLDQTQGVVEKVESHLAYVNLMFGLKGVIPLEITQWARKPNKKVASHFSQVQSLQNILKEGDVIWVRLEDPQKHRRLQESLEEELKEYKLLSLDQKPVAQGALLSFDLQTQDIVSMVGGYNFAQSQFNRAYQAIRQSGSVFKPIIYAAAFDKGFSPNSIISDEPVVYEDEEADLLLQEKKEEEETTENEDSEENTEEENPADRWKPSNYSQRFSGDILFRNALIRSLNVPTVKLIEQIGIPWIEFYSRRLGIISPLNADYTMALGSSSITLYEMAKAFSIFARGGKRIEPLMVRSILNLKQENILENLSLDKKFKNMIQPFQEEFQEKWEEYWALKDNQDVDLEDLDDPDNKEKESSIFFKDINQVIPEKTAYLTTSLLQGVIFDPGGTGGRARDIDRPMAGKTGTTNGYYDSWFIGYSPQILTGVWVGFDNEESLGQSETGSKAALPIWHNYMKTIHEDLEKLDFKIPEGIVFAYIDNETGLLANASSKEVIRQAFSEGKEPTEEKKVTTDHEDQQFLRGDFSL